MVKDPAPGTGTSYKPGEPSISKAAAEAGLTPPASQDPKPQPAMGTYIQELSDAELYKELEDLSLNEFVKKHTEDKRATVDTMARVTRLDRDDIAQIQKDLGFQFAEGF